MAEESFPLVNGEMPSWAEFSIDLVPLGGTKFETDAFNAFEFDDGMEGEKVRGTGSVAIGRTAGEHDANGSMSMYLDASITFQDALKAIAIAKGSKDPERDMYLVTFDVIGSYVPLLEGIPGTRTITVKLESCRLVKREVKMAPGTAATAKTMPLSVMRVYERAA